MEKEMWIAGTAGGIWRWQLKTELDGVEWSVAYE